MNVQKHKNIMKISKKILESFNSCILDKPPEIGGILGSHDNEVIDELVMDEPNPHTIKNCSYTPNISFLNQNIELWQSNNINFKGLFHTHYYGIKTLSCGDRKYIAEIMNSLPKSIKYLYFPVFVLPNRELICYKAVRENDTVFIEEEPLIIEE